MLGTQVPEQFAPGMNHLGVVSELDLDEIECADMFRIQSRAARPHEHTKDVHAALPAEGTILQVPREPDAEKGSKHDCQ